MVLFINHLATFAHSVLIENTSIRGRIICKGTLMNCL
jgi:hypothetical protein